MSESYVDGDVVWVKLGTGGCWWPGEVCGDSRLPDELNKSLGSMKKAPLAVVRFFQEEQFEYVKNQNAIYKYNCEKKDEFIRKGLKLYRSNKDYMCNFPTDVSTAEQLTGGDPDIINNEEYLVEKNNRKEITAEIMQIFPGSSAKKIKANKLSPAKKKLNKTSPTKTPRLITHPRFIKNNRQDEHEIRILTQPSTSSATKRYISPAVATPTTPAAYNCHICSFSCNRQNVIVLHTKSHLNDHKYSTPEVKPKTALRVLPSPKEKKTVAREETITDITPVKKKASDQASTAKKVKKTAVDSPKSTKGRKPKANKKVVEQVESAVKVDNNLKRELLADWSEDEDNNENNVTDSPAKQKQKPAVTVSPGAEKPSLTPSGTIIKYRNIPKKNIRDFMLEADNEEKESPRSLSNDIIDVNTDKSNDSSISKIPPQSINKPISAKERILNRMSIKHNSVDDTATIKPFESPLASPAIKETEVDALSPKTSKSNAAAPTLSATKSIEMDTQDSLVEKMDVDVPEQAVTPVAVNSAEKTTSCFDFDDDEDVQDISLTTKSPKVLPTKNSEKENDDIKSKIDSFLKETIVPDIAASITKSPANNIVTSPETVESFDAKDRKLPPKERGKRIFKSRNKSSIENPQQQKENITEQEQMSKSLSPAKHSDIGLTAISSEPSESDLQIAETLMNLPKAGMQMNVDKYEQPPMINPRKRRMSHDLSESKAKHIKHAITEDPTDRKMSMEEDSTVANSPKLAALAKKISSPIQAMESHTENKNKLEENENNVFDINNMEILITNDAETDSFASAPVAETKLRISKSTTITKGKIPPTITKRPTITKKLPVVKSDVDSAMISNQIAERIPKATEENELIEDQTMIPNNSDDLDDNTETSSLSDQSIASAPLVIKRKIVSNKSSIINSNSMKTKKIIIKNSNGTSTILPLKHIGSAGKPITKTQVVKASSVGQILITSKGDVITTQSQQTVSTAPSTLLVRSCVPVKAAASAIENSQFEETVRIPPKIEVQSQKIICPGTKNIDKKSISNNKLSEENVVISEHMIIKKCEPGPSSSASPKMLKSPTLSSSPSKATASPSAATQSSKKTSVVIIPASEMEELERMGYVRKNENGEAVATKDYKKFRAEKDKLAEQVAESSSNNIANYTAASDDVVEQVTEEVEPILENNLNKPIAITTSKTSPPLPATISVPAQSPNDVRSVTSVAETIELGKNNHSNNESAIQIIQNDACASGIPSTIMSSSIEVQSAVSATTSIPETAQILAVPADNFGGPPNSFYLCQVCDDGNLQPIDNQPLYLDSTNQLVPISSAASDSFQQQVQIEFNDDNAAQIAGSLIQQQSQTGGGGAGGLNQSVIISTGDGQQIIMDRQSLLAIVGSAGGNGGELPQFITPDGQPIVLGQDLINALTLNSAELNLEGLTDDGGVATQDILANALGNSQIYQSILQPKVIGDGLVNNILYQPAKVSETNAVLTQPPIMSTVEVPTNNNNLNLLHGEINSALIENNLNLDDSLAVLGVTPSQTNIPTSLELPITVTNPAIAAKISNPSQLSSILNNTTSTSVTAAVIATSSQQNLNYIYNVDDADTVASNVFVEDKMEEELNENNIVFCNAASEIEILDGSSVNER